MSKYKNICVKCNIWLRPDGLCVICDEAGPEPCEEMIIDAQNEVKDYKAKIDALVAKVVGKVDINTRLASSRIIQAKINNAGT